MKPNGPPISPAGMAALRTRYDHLLGTERPAIVETKPARNKDEPKYRDEPRYPDSRRPNDDAPRYEKPRQQRYWTERRIINTLHRHGIYW